MGKKLRRSLLFLLPLLIIFFLSGCSNTQEKNIYQADKKTKTITWGIKSDTRLFGLMNIKTGQSEGFDIDMAKALTKKIYGKNAKVKFVTTTITTKIPLLKNGNIDAVIAAMTITPERKEYVDFSTPYFNAGQSLLVKKGSSITSIKDLNKKNITVLAVKGSTAVANIEKYAPKAKVLEYDDYGQAFTALKSGQGDAMTTDNGILYGIAKENKGYAVVGGTFTNEPYGIAVNKGQKQLLHAINKALAELKEDGTYARLANKWFGDVAGFNLKEAEGQ
ncbi:transporter substrate-binding domain-containing protein [Ligilactobacillus sp. WILCCON 0076]|uniref:Transporter substrate-binding domain-containing protein n=1 Tax=Ligilactobacillus ubinensis TaxID=2876789 RepID=A0A9X2FKA4_9LACO|nr:transporter substrate-binding domain-containing protein [Ligilactobacillus ubinensis]MCP0887242.1 transporter substrate-binding domain-containing protein [Ligilactobacillus ubinensis]